MQLGVVERRENELLKLEESFIFNGPEPKERWWVGVGGGVGWQ